MSKKMLRVSLDDLKTVRVSCLKCKRGVIEVPIDRLDAALHNGRCRLCDTQLLPQSGPEPLNSLKLALQELAAKAKDLAVEFEIPEP